MLKQQEQQQQMMMMMMFFNQQQQQSQALLSFMGKIVPKQNSYFHCLLFGYTEDQFSLCCPYFLHVIN